MCINKLASNRQICVGPDAEVVLQMLQENKARWAKTEDSFHSNDSEINFCKAL